MTTTEPTILYSFIRKSVPDDISSSFKERDDDLSSKQGSQCTFKLIFYLVIYLHIFIFIIKSKHNMNIFFCELNR